MLLPFQTFLLIIKACPIPVPIETYKAEFSFFASPAFNIKNAPQKTSVSTKTFVLNFFSNKKANGILIQLRFSAILTVLFLSINPAIEIPIPLKVWGLILYLFKKFSNIMIISSIFFLFFNKISSKNFQSFIPLPIPKRILVPPISIARNVILLFL